MAKERRSLWISILIGTAIGTATAGIFAPGSDPSRRKAWASLPRGGGWSELDSDASFFGSFEDEIRREREKFELETMESLEDLQNELLQNKKRNKDQQKHSRSTQEELTNGRIATAAAFGHQPQQLRGFGQSPVTRKGENQRRLQQERRVQRSSGVDSRDIRQSEDLRAMQQRMEAERRPNIAASNRQSYRTRDDHHGIEKEMKDSAIAFGDTQNPGAMEHTTCEEHAPRFSTEGEMRGNPSPNTLNKSASKPVEADQHFGFSQQEWSTTISEDDTEIQNDEDMSDETPVASLAHITDAVRIEMQQAKQKKPAMVAVTTVSGGVKSLAKKPSKKSSKKKAARKKSADIELLEARKLLQLELESAQKTIARSEWRHALITGTLLALLCVLTALALRVVERSLVIP